MELDLNDTVIEITSNDENNECTIGAFSELNGNPGRMM